MSNKSGLWGEIPYRLYQALANAETGGERNKFIRTRYAPKQGSSAYGPVQITKGLVDKSDARGLFQGAGIDKYIDRYQEQGRRFLKYGREPHKKGYHTRYDYGGEGDLTSEEDQKKYTQMADILIRDTWKQAVRDNPDDPVDTFIRYWKYGIQDAHKQSLSDKRTKGYYGRFQDYFKGMLQPDENFEDVAP